MSEAIPWYLRNYTQQFTAKDEYRLLSRVESVLGQQIAEKNGQRDTAHIHPSEMSKHDWCERASYYQITGEDVSDPESFSLRRLNIFAEGHYIHEKWQEWMWRAGGLVGVFRCHRCGYGWMDKSPERCPECGSNDLRYREVPIQNDEYLILGHADGEWEDSTGRALVELKSIGLGTIRFDAPALYIAYEQKQIDLDELWRRIKRPLMAHRKQINLYMYVRALFNAIVIYEWKPTQEVKEFHLTYDDALVRPLLAKAKKVVDALHDEIPPPRPAPARDSPLCKMCPFKTKCWNAKI
jgi:rubrerythrin/CRISPR/Cas system-associated exonuclease Cas4 (RecB family)